MWFLALRQMQVNESGKWMLLNVMSDTTMWQWDKWYSASYWLLTKTRPFMSAMLTVSSKGRCCCINPTPNWRYKPFQEVVCVCEVFVVIDTGPLDQLSSCLYKCKQVIKLLLFLFILNLFCFSVLLFLRWDSRGFTGLVHPLIKALWNQCVCFESHTQVK